MSYRLSNRPGLRSRALNCARALGTLLCIASVSMVAGCSKGGPERVHVTGIVTYQGSPVTVGTVLFTPIENPDGKLRPAVGQLSSDGTYVMRAFPREEGIPPGKYRVAVQAYTGSHLDNSAKYVVPEKFAKAESSGLEIDVPQGTSSLEHNISLDP